MGNNTPGLGPAVYSNIDAAHTLEIDLNLDTHVHLIIEARLFYRHLSVLAGGSAVYNGSKGRTDTRRLRGVNAGSQNRRTDTR